MNFTSFLKFLLFSLLPSSIFSQSGYEEIIKPRKDFSYNKVSKFDTEKIILQNDTLYNNKLSLPHLDYLKKISGFYHNGNSLVEYMLIAFGNSEKYNLKQWTRPIKIFIDRNIPKEVREEFQTFYTQSKFKEIKNLSISFTNRIEDADFHIKVVEKPINGYSENYEFPSEEQRKNYFLTGITYNLQIDQNAKLYAAVMFVNLETANYKNGLLRKLKQSFYKSLGNFAGINYDDVNSLSHYKNYNNSAEISETDIDILKIHYATIYEQRIDYKKFRNLVNLAIKMYD